MPWAQNLWEKVEQHSKKGFLKWCKILKKVTGNKGEDVVMWNNEYLRSVDEIFCDMVAKMSRIHSSTINKMQEFFIRLEKACIELHQPMPEIKEEGLSLYEAQQQLLKYVNEYEVVINAKKLAQEKQIQLCKELDQKLQIDLKYPPLLTQAQFDNLNKYIDKLEAEKFEREKKFVNLKHEFTEIVDEIKYKPNSDFEREVLSSDDMMLSNQNLKMLEFFAKCMKELKLSTEEEESHLRTRIEDLWKMLDIELIIDRDEFISHYTGNSLDTLEALKIEVKRCEKLRKANIKNFVDKLRDQLQTIWTKCHCSDADKKSFRYFYNDFYTEDLLDLHELEIQKWKKYYEDNDKLLDIIKKHQELWDKMIQFEENATGVIRFKNRGGQLLQEEKERNKLSKVIPQLEEQMLNLSGAFLLKNGVVFKTFGSTVEEYIQNLHESRENDRKTKLSARKLQRTHTPGKFCMSLFPPSTTVTPKTLASASKRKTFATPTTENTAKRPKATPATVGLKTKGAPRVISKIKVTHHTMSLPKQRRSRLFQEKQKRKRALRQSRGAQNENVVPDPNETKDTTYHRRYFYFCIFL
ncbi:unnamed protein product [Ceutorhynchus assimilis]|uniref:Protein regulator of cytokinesis 1 n=1 Tax=Ceutorhynchus assimilis TaxID=467358 RepID=A0A9N9QLZ5_9CUCU|nr:unnamed protein product [Ceutorhynchus assimilis]